MNEMMDFQSPGNPMYHLLHPEVNQGRGTARSSSKPNHFGVAEAALFTGILALIILATLVLERWERRKMKKFWNESTTNLFNHEHTQK
ncbi:MAG: hypothetical protein AB7U29_18860 [Desulfobulbus sp.]